MKSFYLPLRHKFGSKSMLVLSDYPAHIYEIARNYGYYFASFLGSLTSLMVKITNNSLKKSITNSFYDNFYNSFAMNYLKAKVLNFHNKVVYGATE